MTFTHNLVVTQSQVDRYKKIKLKSLVDILQDVEAMHIDSLSVFSGYLKKHQIGIFLMYREIEIFQNIYQKDQLKSQSFPYQTNPIMGFRNTIIKDINDQVIVGTTSLGSFINLNTLKIERLPKEVTNSLDHQNQFPGLSYNTRKIDISHLKFDKVEETPIINTHIDSYNHVNNSVYIQLTEHFIPNNYQYKLVKLEYKKALNLGDKAYIYVSNNHLNDLTILIKNEFNEECFVMMVIN